MSEFIYNVLFSVSLIAYDLWNKYVSPLLKSLTEESLLNYKLYLALSIFIIKSKIVLYLIIKQPL